MSTTHKSAKPKSKSMGSAKPIVKGDVVLLSQKRIGVVRYVGEIAEYNEKGIWYGIEIRITSGILGNCNGSIDGTQYFKCAANEGLFVKLADIQRRIEPKELLEKVVKLTKTKNSLHQLLSQSHAEINKYKKTLNIATSPKTSTYTTSSSCNKKKSKRARKPSLDDNNSGSATYTKDTMDDVSISDAPRSSLEFSISNDYSVTMTANSRYSKYSQYRKNTNVDVSDDDTLPPTDELLESDLHEHENHHIVQSPDSINEAVWSPPHKEESERKQRSMQNLSDSNSKTKKSAQARASVPVLSTAVAIQIAKPLKATHKQTSYSHSDHHAPYRSHSQPQLIIAMNNELSPKSFAAKQAEIESWSTAKVLEWLQSFAECGDHEWSALIPKMEQHAITGHDLLSMDDTDLLSERLGIDSPQIRYKLMAELAKQFKVLPSAFPNVPASTTSKRTATTTSPLSLRTSSSSPARQEDIKVVSTDSNSKHKKQRHSSSRSQHHHHKRRRSRRRGHSKHAVYDEQEETEKPFPGYHRLSLSSSPRNNKKVTFHGNGNGDGDEESISMARFIELHRFFTKMDRSKSGKVDFNAFLLFVVELDADFEPFKLSNQSMQKCFDEFDLTKNGSICIEEFIVVMGKTYLRGRHKSSRKELKDMDITKYFIQLIKHFLRKQDTVKPRSRHDHPQHRNAPHVHAEHGGDDEEEEERRSRKWSASLSQSTNKPPPPPPRRQHSTSISRSRSMRKPPPPRPRDASLSNHASNSKYEENHHSHNHNHHAHRKAAPK